MAPGAGRINRQKPGPWGAAAGMAGWSGVDCLGWLSTGLSLGSILLPAALGLALTCGPTGGINRPHGHRMVATQSKGRIKLCRVPCRTPRNEEKLF